MVSVHLHHLRSMLAKTAEILKVAVVAKAIGVLRGKDCWGSLVLFLAYGRKF